MDIKFGDILTYTDKWFKVNGTKPTEKPVRFVATGKITVNLKGEYVIYVVKEDTGYVSSFHHSLLKSFNPLSQRR